MNKVDCASRISAASGLSVKDANLALNTALDVIGEALQRGEEVSLHGFGTFAPRERSKRTVIHPQTKEPMEVAATRTVAFKPATNLRKRLTA